MNSIFTRQGKSLAIAAAFFLCSLLPQIANAALSGTYTINASSAASSTNYKTFASAISDLNSGTRADGGTANGSGVSGAVVFNVANGTYNEQVSISTITGASATKTVTFQSASGDSSKVILTYAAGSGQDYTLQLASAQYIIIKKISIIRSGTGSPSKALVLSGASNNQFLNNRIIGVMEPSTSSSFPNPDNAAIHFSGSDTNNLLKNNYVIYGHSGIFISASSSSNKIIGNTIDTVGGAAIYALGQTNLLIDQNLIRFYWTGSTAPYVAYAVRLESSSDFKITRNKIYSFNSATVARAIVFFNNLSTSSKPGLIANNWIRQNAGTSSSTGISLANVEYLNVYYNTIYNTSSVTTASAFHIYSGYAAGTDINLLNNNLVNKGGGYVYDIADLTGVKTSDYNNLYTSGTNIGNINGTTYTTLAAWRTASKKEANSINIDPNFVSSTDLHPKNPALKGTGIKISSITTDIEGKARKTPVPDIGANEFDPSNYDAGILSLSSPSNVCMGKNDLIVVLRNYGLIKLTSATINFTVNDTGLRSYSWTGSLLTDSSVKVNVGNINYSNLGNTRIKIWSRLPNNSLDEFTYNDTLKTTIRVLALPTATTGGNQSICIGNSTQIGAAAVGGNLYSWTSKPTGFTSSTANPTINPTVTTTYYLNEKSPFTGCEKSDSLVVKVNAMPVANAGTGSTICLGQSVQLGTSPVTGNTYSWTSKTGGFTSTVSDPMVSPNVTNTYYLTETITATGCAKTDSVVINVNPVPNTNAGQDQSICVGKSVQLGGASVAGNTYSWRSLPAGFSNATSNPIVTPSVTTTYILNQTITATSCNKVDTVVVTVNPLPSAFVGPPRSVCAGQSVTIGNVSVQGRTYTWTSRPAGFTSAIGNPSVAPDVTTVYYLTETVDATGCTKSDSVKISITPSPNAETGADQTICPGQSTKIGAAAVSGNNYSWISVPAGFTSTNSNPTVSPTVTTTYILTEKIGTAGGCSRTDSVTINVAPKPNTTIQGSSAVCINATENYSAVIATGNTYSWDVTGGTISTGQNTDKISVKWGAGTSGKVKLTVTTAGGCQDSTIVNTTISELPNAKFKMSKMSARTFHFTPADTTLANYAWSFGDGGTSTVTKPTYTYPIAGTYKVRLVAKNSTGCSRTFDSTFTTTVGIMEEQVPAENISIYPNPFKESTTIAYTLTGKARVKVQVYDMAGKEVANITDATQTPGEYKYNFNASQYNAGAGMYIVKMVIGDKFVSRQIINLK